MTGDFKKTPMPNLSSRYFGKLKFESDGDTMTSHTSSSSFGLCLSTTLSLFVAIVCTIVLPGCLFFNPGQSNPTPNEQVNEDPLSEFDASSDPVVDVHFDPTLDGDALVDVAPDDVVGDSLRDEGEEAGDLLGDDTDATDLPDSADADEIDCPEGEVFSQSRPIVLTEPCAEMSPAFRDGLCDEDGPAYDDGSSSWQRTDEPVEIPLVNGIIDSSVVGYWPLDGGEAVDSSGNTNDGALSEPGPVPADSVFGDIAGAMEFGGDGDVVIVSHDPAIDFGDEDFTVSVWFKTDETFQNYLISKNYGPTSRFWGISVYGVFPGGDPEITDGVAGVIHDGTSTTVVQTPNIEVTDNQWHHVALVRNTRDVRLLIFLDGILAGSVPDASGSLANTADLWIGGLHNPGDYRYFDGDIDDVLIFNRALTPTEIAAYYESRQPYGTSFVPDAQEDFDDIRVTEQEADVDPERITHEVVGVRPHSDTDLDHIAAYWRLDGNVNEETGSHTSTNDGAEGTIGRFGDTDGAMYFDDSTYIDTGFAPAYGLSDAFTIEAWARIEPEVGHGIIIGYENDSSYLNISVGSGVVSANLVDAGGTSSFLTSSSVAGEDGAWHHYAFVRDTSADKVRLYFDGVLLVSEDDMSTTEVDPGSRAFFIGALDQFGSPNATVIGDIDEVIIHDVARSADYIYNRANPGIPMVRFLGSTEAEPNDDGHYDYQTYRLYWDNPDAQYIPPVVPDPDDGEPCEGLLSPCNGYVGWWRFDEGSGNVVVDASTRGIHLTMGAGDAAPNRVASLDRLALNFDGTDDEVTGNLDYQWSSGDWISIEALANRASVGGQQRPIATQTTSDGCPSLQFGFSAEAYEVDDNRLEFYYCDESVIQGQRYGSDVEYLDTTSWYHVGFSLQFADSGSALLVTNGVVQPGGWRHSNGTVGPVAGGSNFTIGNRYGLADQVYHGSLDSVRIMNRALEADEFLHFPISGSALGELSNALECVAE